MDAMTKVNEQVRRLRGQLDDLQEDTRYKARHVARVADHRLHEHPYGAMGVAAVAGMLVGFLAATARR